MNQVQRLWGMITPGARGLMLVVIITSALFNWITQAASPPLSLAPTDWLTLHPATLPDLRLPALLLNSAVVAPAGPLGVLIFVGIAVYFFLDLARALWRARRNEVLLYGLGGLLALSLFDALILPGMGWGLVMGLLLIAWFGVSMERRWGARRLIEFVLIVALTTNTLGALFLWLVPHPTAPLLGAGHAPLQGVGAVITALMGAWCLGLGRRRVALLNVTGDKLFKLLVVIEGLHLLLTSKALGWMGLSALLTSWLLVTGRWRPEILKDHLKLWRLRARRRLRVIQGGRR
ncbi:rhomboid family intramembrane serine protease [Myxococcota bacterium]|nr:rhomboid family intramembrane serine protease [Myxococcota bacterium]MBU1432331.1 rhomboid family intramembrane serine protease [Myxococcota bacterium]MBU1897074.1 rhomboid family intramembrane serine protease [Myxococcota bacterium]